MLLNPQQSASYLENTRDLENSKYFYIDPRPTRIAEMPNISLQNTILADIALCVPKKIFINTDSLKTLETVL